MTTKEAILEWARLIKTNEALPVRVKEAGAALRKAFKNISPKKA